MVDYKCTPRLQKIMEKSLIILKPDCMKQNLAGAVMDRFAKAGFSIKGCKMMRLTEELLKDHYSHLADKPFFPEIVDFMSSSPVIVLILSGNCVIDKVRDILGATDPKEAAEGTIRAEMGTDKMRNIAHASDSQENAKLEIERFFKPAEIF